MNDSTCDKDSQTGTSACRVFVVEDHEALRRKIELLLNISEDIICVGTAGSGKEALEATGEADFDVLLIDLSLPVVSGLDVMSRIRSLKPEAKCLVISGYSQREHVRSAMDAGAKGFVAKGDPAEITKAIRAVNSGQSYFSDDLAP